jgi:predicted small lipoprotein YifL
VKPNFFLQRLAVILVLTSAVTACGQRGPLYMPGSKPATKTKPAIAPNLKAPQTSSAAVKPDASVPAKPDASAPAQPDASASDKQ